MNISQLKIGTRFLDLMCRLELRPLHSGLLCQISRECPEPTKSSRRSKRLLTTILHLHISGEGSLFCKCYVPSNPGLNVLRKVSLLFSLVSAERLFRKERWVEWVNWNFGMFWWRGNGQGARHAQPMLVINIHVGAVCNIKKKSTGQAFLTRRSQPSGVNDFEAHCEVSVNGAGARSVARLKRWRPAYPKSFSARHAQSCALLITVEEILSGPAVAFFLAVFFFLRVWVVSLLTRSSCTPRPCQARV